MMLSILSTFILFQYANAFSTSPHHYAQTILRASNANELMPMQQGSSCAIITPMLDSGKIDFHSLRNLLQYHLDSGTDNLCILGTTGEASVMSMDERSQVLKTAVEMVKGKMPILVSRLCICAYDISRTPSFVADLTSSQSYVADLPHLCRATTSEFV